MCRIVDRVREAFHIGFGYGEVLDIPDVDIFISSISALFAMRSAYHLHLQLAESNPTIFKIILYVYQKLVRFYYDNLFRQDIAVENAKWEGVDLMQCETFQPTLLQ